MLAERFAEARVILEDADDLGIRAADLLGKLCRAAVQVVGVASGQCRQRRCSRRRRTPGRWRFGRAGVALVAEGRSREDRCAIVSLYPVKSL